jgi:hypothetical protein
MKYTQAAPGKNVRRPVLLEIHSYLLDILFVVSLHIYRRKNGESVHRMWVVEDVRVKSCVVVSA